MRDLAIKYLLMFWTVGEKSPLHSLTPAQGSYPPSSRFLIFSQIKRRKSVDATTTSHLVDNFKRNPTLIGQGRQRRMSKVGRTSVARGTLSMRN